MRPSPHLLTLALGLTALTVALVLGWPNAAGLVASVWGILVVVAVVDLLTSTPRKHLSVVVAVQNTGYTGGVARLVAQVVSIKGALPQGLIARLDLDAALGSGDLPAFAASADNLQAASGTDLALSRRGVHAIRTIALKWRSKLGLFEIIGTWPIGHTLAVVPDIAPVLSGQINTRMLPLTEGQKDMQLRGEGSEFHQLRDYVAGMDPRQIDWKRSARMRSLVARETRAEKNHQIILCLDSGHLMSERIGGLAKLDRAINAALAMAWAGGLGGDQVGLYSFDSQPRMFVPPAPGRAAFARLQATCAALRYESVETNHTLGLSHLSGRLARRSLIIVFSDFVDSITAELMVENLTVLTRRHLVLFVALRDPALAALAHPTQVSMEAVAQSVAATQVLQERRSVLDRLARLGVICLDTTPETLTAGLISRYIDIKSRELI
jgi:uncharacterized protein (DUF58 family)